MVKDVAVKNIEVIPNTINYKRVSGRFQSIRVKPPSCRRFFKFNQTKYKNGTRIIKSHLLSKLEKITDNMIQNHSIQMKNRVKKLRTTINNLIEQNVQFQNHRSGTFIMMKIDHIPYYKIKQLGRGNQGAVYLFETNNGDQFDIKYSVEPQYSKKQSKHLNEAEILRALQGHPSIQKWVDSRGQARDLEYEWFIQMVHFEGVTLFDYIRKSHPHASEELEEAELKTITDQLISGMSHIHKQQIVHQDIKPENILIGKNNRQSIEIKIIDFGSSRKLKDYGQQWLEGTPRYWHIKCLTPVKRSIKISGDIALRNDKYALGATLCYVALGHQLDYTEWNELNPSIWYSKACRRYLWAVANYHEYINQTNELISHENEEIKKIGLYIKSLIQDENPDICIKIDIIGTKDKMIINDVST